MNPLLNAWIPCMIISLVLMIFLVNQVLNIDKNSDIYLFLTYLAGLLSLIGLILYIIWLTQYNNKSVLKYLWIVSLIILIVSTAISIFTFNSYPELSTSINLIGSQMFVIFIGAIIAFFTKNK